MAHIAGNGGESEEIEGSYRPSEPRMIGEKHSEGFDLALDDALKRANLRPGQYNGKIRYEIDVEVTNPPGITDYKVYLQVGPR